jgi:ketosteroid isomerase-like protein
VGHANEEVIRKGYAAFNNGDFEGIKGTLADDIVWHVSGRNPFAGEYKGLEEVFGFFGKLGTVFDGPPSLELHDVLANDEHAAVLITSTAKKNGKTHTSNQTHIFHMKDGKAVEFWGLAVNPYEDDEFASS